MLVTFPNSQSQFHPSHPIAYMGKQGVGYYRNFVDQVREIVSRMYGPDGRPATLQDPGGKLERYIVPFSHEGRTVRVLIDYADSPEIAPGWQWCDAVFKMKCHPGRFGAELIPSDFDGVSEFWRYPGVGVPVIPAGYIVAPGAGMIDGAEWLREKLPALRELKDGPQVEDYYARAAFKVCKYPIPARDGLRHLDKWPRRRIDVDEYHREMATHRVFLNLCGQGDSIDRKVVEACAIGCEIVSTSGLRDLRLPWEVNFLHSVDIVFADTLSEVKSAIRAQCSGEGYSDIGKNARDVFDLCFHPASLARWWSVCIRRLFSE